VVPVIGKADTLSLEERSDFKRRVNEELKFHKIRVYPSSYSDYDQEGLAANKIVTVLFTSMFFVFFLHFHSCARSQDLIPFAVVGSEKSFTVDGKTFPGRQLGWGVINGSCFSLSFLIFFLLTTPRLIIILQLKIAITPSLPISKIS